VEFEVLDYGWTPVWKSLSGSLREQIVICRHSYPGRYEESQTKHESDNRYITRKIAARVSGLTTVCGRTTSLSSLGVSISSIPICVGVAQVSHFRKNRYLYLQLGVFAERHGGAR
jgi:hypothetical protein